MIGLEKIGVELDSEGEVDGHDSSTNTLINNFKSRLNASADYTPWIVQDEGLKMIRGKLWIL